MLHIVFLYTLMGRYIHLDWNRFHHSNRSEYKRLKHIEKENAHKERETDHYVWYRSHQTNLLSHRHMCSAQYKFLRLSM